jgi:hypothetical protein
MVPLLLAISEKPMAQLAGMLEMRRAAHWVLFVGYDPVKGGEGLLLGREVCLDGDVAVQAESLLHLLQLDLEGPPQPGARLPVLLQLIAKAEELVADAAAEAIGSAAPLAGERLARHLGHLLLLIVFLLTHHMGFVQTRQFRPYFFVTK